MGWRGSWLAVWLARGAVRHYCLGGCSAMGMCAGRSRPVRGGWGRCRVLCLPRFLSPPRVSHAVCGGLSRLAVPYPRSLVRHSIRSVRSAGSVRLPFWFSPRVPCACMRSRSRGVRPPPPPRLVWRAHLARSRCWVLVGPFHAVCAPPRVLLRSRAPFGLLWGGGDPFPFPPTWLGAARSPWGRCGCGDPSPTPPRAVLRAGFACCGGGTRVPGGQASCLGVGRPRSGALRPLTTRPFGRAAGAGYPLAVGAGGAGVGTHHQPHSARSCELALRAVGAAQGRLGGAPLAWVWGVRGRALSHPRPLVLSGVRLGPTTHCLWVRGSRAWGPVTNPTARALASWLCALWGRHEGAPGGGHLLPGCGASGDGRSPTPDCPSFGACDRDPLPTGSGCGGCGHGNPSPTPQRALLQAGFARCAGGMKAPGGGASVLGAGGPGLGALPPRPLVFSSVRPGPTTHWLWVWGCRRGDPSPTPQRALLRAGFARCGDGMRVPGGRAPCLGVGPPGSGALPPPTTRPFGRAAGAHYPLPVGAGVAGVGTRQKPHCARSGELALHAAGAA